MNGRLRQGIERLQTLMEKLPQTDCPVFHHFERGSYSRTMVVPRQTVAIGAVHKTQHWTFVLGHCRLTTEHGAMEFKGAHAFVSRPGIKRAIRTFSRTMVMTVHHTDERNLDRLCEQLTESSSAELLGGPRNRQLLAQQSQGAIE